MSKQTIAFSQRVKHAPVGSVSENDQYTLDCLVGHRFPKPDDSALWDRCKVEWRMREWLELYRRIHVTTLKDPRPLLSRLNRYFPPLMDLHPSAITRRVVLHWFEEIGQHSKTQANNSLVTLKALFNKAIEWEIWSGVNPCQRVKKFPFRARERFITPGQEMRRLLEALAIEAEDVQTFFLTCLFTGCRKGEACLMKWADLNFTSNTWTKPTTKSGTSHVMPLPPALVERFQRLPRLGDFVFDFPNREGHWSVGYASLQWSRIRKRGHLPEVTVHDLRRTCASYLAMAGANASVIAKTLNHSSLQHTGIYARLDTTSLRTALDRQAEGILGFAARSATPPAVNAPSVQVTHFAQAPMPIEREEWPG